MTATFEVRARHKRFHGFAFDVVTDEVTMPDGGVAQRDYLQHVGSVGVVAIDERDRVVLVRQYRHPVGRALWELPAGLRDVDGEDLATTALRELAEEADLVAGRLDLLVDLHTSPGCSDEVIRLFLARDLTPVPAGERHERHDEEAALTVAWYDLDEAISLIFAGEVTNGPTAAGLLATAHARTSNWTPLRPTTTPVP